MPTSSVPDLSVLDTEIIPLLSLSIVSHGQGDLIRHLLNDLKTLSGFSFEVILTLNIAEDEGYFADAGQLRLRVIRNVGVKGFGANHNAAFDAARGAIFVIVNPDIRALNLDLALLVEALRHPRAGACGPRIVSPSGKPEDSPRRFPTVCRLAHRVLSRTREPDYSPVAAVTNVDWVAGMFVAFRRDAFIDIGGFDERFFMYMEDVDICRRLRRREWQVCFEPRTEVVHEGQRQNRRRARHIAWHLRSLFRYLFLDRLTCRWAR